MMSAYLKHRWGLRFSVILLFFLTYQRGRQPYLGEVNKEFGGRWPLKLLVTLNSLDDLSLQCISHNLTFLLSSCPTPFGPYDMSKTFQRAIMIVFSSNNKRKLQEGRFQEMKLMQLHSSSQLLVCSSPSLLDPSFHPSILDGNSAFTHVLVKEYTVGK